ncbi:MAG: hypothetical protein Q4D41_12665, partial [Prevotellaceae bacterium]|nr:hypothetical protein [Prevotellaceae bacterium]
MKLKYIFFITLIFIVSATHAETQTQSAALIKKALVLYEEDNFPQAMKYFTKSLEMAEKEKDYHSYMV